MQSIYIYADRMILLFCFAFFFGVEKTKSHTLWGPRWIKKIVEEEGGKKIAVRLHRLIKKLDMKTKKRKRERFC